MNEARAFHQAIVAEPNDDTHRLVFADWLEDNDDAERAEFIRVQVELAQGAEGGRLRQLRCRESELLRANESKWRASLPQLAGIKWGEFRRGFVEEASAKFYKSFETHAASIRAAIPLLTLNLDLAAGFKSFERATTLAGLRRLVVDGWIEYPGVKALAECEHLAGLRELRAKTIGVNEAGVRALAGSPHLAGLTALEFDNARSSGIAGAVALATSAHLTQLTRLALCRASANAEGASALASSPNLTGLQSLELWGNAIGDEGTRCLAQSTTLPRLRHLGLALNLLGPAGAAALADSPLLARLHHLDLGGNHDLGKEGLLAIVRSPHVGSLTHLSLTNTDISDDIVEELASSTRFTNLETLSMGEHRLTDAAAFALAESPNLPNLKSLTMTSRRFTHEGIKAIVDSPHLKSLTTLNIVGVTLERKTKRMLEKRFG